MTRQGEIITALGISILGGITNYARSKNENEKFKLSRLIVVVFTAAFSGLLVEMITSALGFSIEYQCVISGVAGYSGGTFLDDIVKRFTDVFFSRLEQKK
ncbi:MAG: phage holin family protein [Synergistaceae bacterium]|nr:phage holin family protein [Synergistaceae bacterium]